MTWRDKARPIIEEVLSRCKGKPEKEIKKALREAYPWGPRNNYPYKVWLDECKVQMGKKKVRQKKHKPDEDRRQMMLFNKAGV